MTRQTDEKKQEWHGHFRKYGKRPEDAAGPLGKKKKPTKQIQQKIATNKQSLRRTGLKIQARKKSRGKEKDWI